MTSFLVVQFVVKDGEEKEVAVVPKSWINETARVCKWPNRKGTIPTSWVQNARQPAEDWIDCEYEKIKGRYGKLLTILNARIYSLFLY